MTKALFAFDDRAAAQRVWHRLVDEERFAQSAVQLHVHDEIPPGAAGEVDEIVTGGFVHNFGSLWHGVFDEELAPQAAGPYADVIRRGGAVLGIDAESDAEQSRVDAVMADAAPAARSGWRKVSAG